MINKRKPQILSHAVVNQSVTLELKVDGDIIDFEGHFSSFPLLPGVTQIDWVLYYAEYYLHVSLPFIGMEVIKFQEPILPEAIVHLQINWDEIKGKLAFTYSSNQTTTHSSGKIKLGHRE